VRGPTPVLKEFLASEEEIQASVIEHVTQIMKKLKDIITKVQGPYVLNFVDVNINVELSFELKLATLRLNEVHVTRQYSGR
jgi:hypothetical protein